jgi:Carboxypeptidase regulatory-like domain
MKRALAERVLVGLGIAAMFAAIFWVGVPAAIAQKGATGKVLTGKVLDKQDNPLPSAVVYLTDTRTRAVKTYIVSKDGGYRFTAMSPNVDYEIYAQFNGKKSDTKMLSQFDNRSIVNINLKVDTR